MIRLRGSTFVRKRDMLYDLKCKFTVEDLEISALSIRFHLNKLLF